MGDHTECSIIPGGIPHRIFHNPSRDTAWKRRDPTWDTPGIPGGNGGIPPHIFTWAFFFFLRTLFIQPVLNSNFQTNFIIFLILLDLLVSVNILVIKVITSNLADVLQITFSLNLLTFYHLKGLVLVIKV